MTWYNYGVRPYFTLLRLPYQLQLGPIFGWGYLLADGHLRSVDAVLHFTAMFLLLHVGAFGGLTALNSYYDRDTGPVGGLWQPPAPPDKLFLFAWSVQLGGLLLLLAISPAAALFYGAILVLSLGYSHPRTRWKGNAWKSLATVTVGQGVFDCMAGACATGRPQWSPSFWCGLCGASLTVAGFYPLTQLYQVADDLERGDRTLAATLVAWGRRDAVFEWAMALLAFGEVMNGVALWQARLSMDAGLVGLASIVTVALVESWRRQRHPDSRDDYLRVHTLMRGTAVAFGTYLVARLVAS